MRHFQEDAGALWREAGTAQPAPPESVKPGVNQAWLLKSESRVRVLLRRPDPDGACPVSKVYRTPPRLAWRTLCMTSRARREYHNLVYAQTRGLPVVRPLGWSETRRLGCVWFSQITTGWVPGENLILYMKKPGKPSAMRDEVIGQVGEMLAAMHRAGFAWGTALPRNVMVEPPSPDLDLPRVSALDCPYAFCTGKDMIGSQRALFDLWSFASDWLAREELDNRFLDLLYSSYARFEGSDPVTLRGRVEGITPTQLRLNRFGMRIVQAFQLSPI